MKKSTLHKLIDLLPDNAVELVYGFLLQLVFPDK